MTSYGVKLTWGSLWGTYTMSTALFHRPKVWDGGVADFWCPYAIPHLYSQGTDEKILASLPLFRWGARKLVGLGGGGVKYLKPENQVFERERTRKIDQKWLMCVLCFWTKFGTLFLIQVLIIICMDSWVLHIFTGFFSQFKSGKHVFTQSVGFCISMSRLIFVNDTYVQTLGVVVGPCAWWANEVKDG